ncbi:Protein of unknown function DUF3133 [Cynara cardunculus var. scolymus]|uniref:Uncharacterized protein n=1 Tax=Cynara cardunculus var. scolymus TaxID=59895 RepID=A0A103YJ64_CYNCS|nr:Protein of unknown function DUF3133 [Cynara cardunculus var. scolymus]
MNTKVRLVRCPNCRNVLPEPPGVPVYKCGGCGIVLQAKKRKNGSDDQVIDSSSNQQPPVSSIGAPGHNRMDGDQDAAMKSENDTVDAPSNGMEQYSSGKRKMEQLSDDQEAASSSNQDLLVSSVDEPHRDGDHNDIHTGHEDPESLPETTTHNRMNQDHDATKMQLSGRLEEYSSGKWKTKQLSDDQEAAYSSSNQQSLVNSINEPDRNTDHNDPQSSPEAAVHNRIDPDQDHHHDHDYDQVMFPINGVLGNHKIGDEFEENSSISDFNEIEEPSREAIANIKIVRDSDGGSKSSFKSLIAEKLLDTRQKKVVYLDDDDTISEDGSADLCHRQRFERVSSAETLENGRFGGMSYYGYEGSVSSFDGNNNQILRKNHIGPKGDERHHYKRRNGHGVKDEHRSMDVRSFYGNTSPLRHGMNEFHGNPRHRSSVIPENPKMERLELLKMVRELQDQLERTNVSNAAPQIPSYRNNFSNHPGRYGQRMAYSGETTAVNRQRDGGSCYYCCPQDRHFSAQLPRQCVYCNGPPYVPTPCYSSHCSGSSSPQHHSESEFLAPVRSKPEPEDRRQRNDVRKQYRSPKKRFIRPIAGGSPWITCYRCSQLLQLPQSFLVFKRRCHSVRCGGCLKVLNFTLSNGTHVSRYYPEEMIAAPPSSEVEEYANSRADPVSCSDRSFQKSYSTETDRNGSREFIDRRKAIMSRDPSGSAGPSSSKISGRRKATSEIEEVEPAGGSPLHWLMGYASPSKVIRG